MNIYKLLGDRIGTLEARDLAQELVRWHDAMVKHLRVQSQHGGRCADSCPHEAARALWSEALDVFGERAADLRFLQSHGGGRIASGGGAGLPLPA
jgi:hypothetical protein